MISNIPVLQYFVLFFLFMFLNNFLLAQEPKIPLSEREDIISMIENIAEKSEYKLDYTDLLDGLYYLLENPINLNYANADDLKQIIFLSDFHVNKLIEYRNIYGSFLSIYELQAIDGFDEKLIRVIIPFVTISAEKPRVGISPKSVIKYGRHDFMLRYSRILENQDGYEHVPDSVKQKNPGSYFLGNPDRIYARYGFNYSNRIRFGFTADKDPGEEFFAGSQPNGFDFYSGFVSVNKFGVLKNFTLGDYHLEFGQGLTLWTGLAFGKSSDVFSVKKAGRGIKPNTSVNENLFMRGAATTLKAGSFEITGFYSNKKIDANIGERNTVNNEISFITSIQESGYHRTLSEIENRKSLTETVYGGNISFRRNIFIIGATAFKTKLGSSLLQGEQPYKKYYFSGDENFNFGVDFNILIGKLNFFGEFSGSENGGYAGLAGLLANLNPRLTLIFLYRNYQKNYQNLYSNAFSESSYNCNESGMYAGILFKLAKNITFSGYADHYNFPWIKYRIDAPSFGNEYLAQINFHISGNSELYVRYRQENKKINSGDELNMPKIIDKKKQIVRVNFSYNIFPSVLLTNRVEYLLNKKGNNPELHGYLIYQDVFIRPENKPFGISLRYALFDTDTYDERIYAYEADVLYSFSVPAYYYKGSRFYLILKYKITGWLDFWLRFSQTYYNGRASIGSGPNKIEGNTRSEIKAQIRIKL